VSERLESTPPVGKSRRAAAPAHVSSPEGRKAHVAPSASAFPTKVMAVGTFGGAVAGMRVRSGGGNEGGGGEGDGGGGDGGGGGGGGDGGGDGGGGDGGGGNGGGGDGGGGATTSVTRTPVATLTGTVPTTFTWVPVTADSWADSVARGVAARALAAALTWATAALGLPGPLSGMVRSMENRTLAAERRRVITQVGAVQLSRTLSASLRVAIRVAE
jgi:hypothetical protein